MATSAVLQKTFVFVSKLRDMSIAWLIYVVFKGEIQMRQMRNMRTFIEEL